MGRVPCGPKRSRRAINDLGLTPLHRRSFGLVRAIVDRDAQPELGFEAVVAE